MEHDLEDVADALHLADEVELGQQDHAQHRDDLGALAEAIADELHARVLAPAAQRRRDRDGDHHEAAHEAHHHGHQEVLQAPQQGGEAQERGQAHVVGRHRQAVADAADVATGGEVVVAAGDPALGQPADVEEHDDHGDRIDDAQGRQALGRFEDVELLVRLLGQSSGGQEQEAQPEKPAGHSAPPSLFAAHAGDRPSPSLARASVSDSSISRSTRSLIWM